MRKSLLVAGTATLALGLTGIAYRPDARAVDRVHCFRVADEGGDEVQAEGRDAQARASRTTPTSKTTAEKITITFPSTLKISTKGLDQCTASDEELIADPSVCSKAKAGTGTARAVLNPFAATPGPLNFKVVPYVGKNEVLFLLSGSADAVLHGKISGKKMSIIITPQLQQPVPGVFSR